jgi:hypothetical protein
MSKNGIVFVLSLLVAGVLLASGGSRYPIVPAGTEIAVRIQERIDSSSASPGETFAAKVESAIAPDGQVLIPKDAVAKVELVATLDVGPGGSKVYAIELKEVEVDGKWYPVTTGYAEPKAGTRKVRAGQDAQVPAGTTDIDKIVAATARGDGAAMATVHGAGVSFQVLEGPEVVVASDVVVYFTLAELLPLRPK